MSQISGCKSYMSLSSAGQKMIREWTMSSSEKVIKQHLYWNITSKKIKFSDKLRHFQLQNGNTRFCCKISKKKRRYVPTPIHTTQNNSSNKLFLSLLLLIFLFFL